MFKKPEDHYKIIGTLIGPKGETIELIDRAEYDVLLAKCEKMKAALEYYAGSGPMVGHQAIEVLKEINLPSVGEVRAR